MSIEQRAKKRKNKKTIRISIIIGIVFLILLAVFLQYRGSKVSLVQKSEYRDTYDTDLFFFKDIDYIALDGFKPSELTVPEGSKVNGYMTLTKSPLSVNSDDLIFQIETIDMIINEEMYKNWSSILSEISDSFVGTTKIQSQINGTKENTRKKFLVNAVRYMGVPVDQLKEKKEIYQTLNDGSSRNIKINDLKLNSTGYVYSTVNTMEKVISERVLPYMDSQLLRKVGKIDQQNAQALKIINDDHIFIAFELSKDIVIQDAEDILTLKEEYFGTKDSSKNTEYYDMLVKRVDLVRNYPKMAIVKNGNPYDAYMVDIIQSGDAQIVIGLIKDYVNVFAKENVSEFNVNINEYRAYTVEKSAVYEKDGQTFVKKMDTGLYEADVPVTVGNYKDGLAYLPIWKNNDISVDMSYKVYP